VIQLAGAMLCLLVIKCRIDMRWMVVYRHQDHGIMFLVYRRDLFLVLLIEYYQHKQLQLKKEGRVTSVVCLFMDSDCSGF
jgi:hypothetical protein